MFDWLKGLMSWLLSFWLELPDESKKKIIEAFVEALDRILRDYFRGFHNDDDDEDDDDDDNDDDK